MNIAFRLPRSMASSAASRTASRWTWSKARATSPISSVEVTPIGSISTPSSAPSLWLSLRTISGSRWPATSSASERSLRSGRISERATIVETSTTRSSSSSVTRLVTSRSVVALDRSSLARLVTSPFSWSATFRVSPMVNVMSAFQLSGLSWGWALSGTFGEVRGHLLGQVLVRGRDVHLGAADGVAVVLLLGRVDLGRGLEVDQVGLRLLLGLLEGWRGPSALSVRRGETSAA